MQGSAIDSALRFVPGDPLALVTVVAAAGSALLGLYIGYHAYRGLRRNDSTSMRYLSIGMILVFGVTYVVALAGNAIISFDVVPLRWQDGFRAAVRVLQVVGLVFIAYSMRVGTGR